MTHWHKEQYKKNAKPHLVGGKRERLGSNCAAPEEDNFSDEERNFEEIDPQLAEQQVVSPLASFLLF